MAVNKEGTGYTFFFSIAMVVVVGATLAFAYEALRPRQIENMKQEKMKDILKAIGIDVEMKEAPEEFKTYIVKRIILNSEGEVIS